MKVQKSFFICVVLFMSLFFSSCHKPYTKAMLEIMNKTEDVLYIESNIISPVYFNGHRCITIESEYWLSEPIAESSSFKGHIDYNLNMDDLVVNKDEASVKIYLLRNGNKELVKEWTYAKRNEPGRQLFNEKFFSEPYKRVERNYLFYSYVFDILPEDIGK